MTRFCAYIEPTPEQRFMIRHDYQSCRWWLRRFRHDLDMFELHQQEGREAVALSYLDMAFRSLQDAISHRRHARYLRAMFTGQPVLGDGPWGLDPKYTKQPGEFA